MSDKKDKNFKKKTSTDIELILEENNDNQVLNKCKERFDIDSFLQKENYDKKTMFFVVAIFFFGLISSTSLAMSIISFNVNEEQNDELSKFNSYFQSNDTDGIKSIKNAIIELKNKSQNQENNIIKCLSDLENVTKQVLILAKFENQFSELTLKTANLVNQIDILRAEKEKLKSNITSLTTENALLKISLTTHNSTLTIINESIVSLNNNVSNQSSSMDHLKTNVDLLKINITKLEEPSKLIEQFQTISNEIYSISAKVSNITANMSEINNINYQTIKMKTELESFQNSHSLEINELKNLIENLTLDANLSKQLEKEKFRKNNHMYFPEGAIIHDNIFNALSNSVIEFVGSPIGMDIKSHETSKWNGKYIINIGSGVQTNQGGILVHVPEGYKVLWFRVNNDCNATFRVVSKNSSDTKIARYACGYRSLLEISPDGGGPDGYWNIHMWCPIPLYYSGDYMVYSDIYGDDWISGIAFSKNPWNHAKNSGMAFHWALNSGTSINLSHLIWNSDILVFIPAFKMSDLFVPVVPSGKNKTLYIIEFNADWLGTMHTSVLVNDVGVERLRTSYTNNPFATHFNSKIYSRYLALTIPAELIDNDAKFVKITIDMTNSNEVLYFREIGTHDSY